jgi:hypothetical protein
MTSPSLTHDTFEPPEDYAPVMLEPGTDLPVSLNDPQADASGLISATPDTANPDSIQDNAKAETTPTPVRKTIKLPNASDQPYVAGECTVTLTLTLPPGDGPILVGVRSHDAAPLLGTLPRGEFPACLQDLLQRHVARLPGLAAQAEAEKAQRSRKSNTTAAAKAASQKAPTTPTRKHKPDPKAAAPIPQSDLFAEFDQRAAAQS